MRTWQQSAAVAVMMWIAGSVPAFAQSQLERHWVVFRERAPIPTADLHRAAAALNLSERALNRRAKVLSPDRLIDALDFPVSESMLASLRSTGVRIRAVSRWLNAASVEATPEQLISLRTLPSVAQIVPVARFTRTPEEPAAAASFAPLARTTAVPALNYGSSLTQIQNIDAVELHNMGITGTGVVVAMLDDGFNNHTTHEALRLIRVLAEYDFIQRDSNTSRRADESLDQGNHGAGTLSVLGGYRPGALIGAAPGASFILGKTEYDATETHVEEDYYVEGLEWAERLGADIVSTSLGYRTDFTFPDVDYPYSAMDGRTTIVAKAAAVAARKGVLLVTAMGNERVIQYDKDRNIINRGDSTLVSPADADSIVSVGATASDGELATFSGAGPTADGRVKPEVVAQGMAVYWASGATTAGYGYAQGTSLATPLAAGAAALILSAQPELTPMQVREALIRTARRINDGTWQTVTYPNNYYGHGSVDALKAATYFGPISGSTPRVIRAGTQAEVHISLRSSSTLIADSLRFYYRGFDDTTYAVTALVPVGSTSDYIARIPITVVDGGAVGYFSYADAAGHSRRSPYNAPDSVFVLTAALPVEYAMRQNYPNPFNAGTTIIVDIPSTGNIELDVFNILGQHVRTMYRGIASPPFFSTIWNGRNDADRTVASGVYFARLKTASAVLTRKMLFVK